MPTEQEIEDGKRLLGEAYHLLRDVQYGQYDSFKESVLLQVLNRLYYASKTLKVVGVE